MSERQAVDRTDLTITLNTAQTEEEMQAVATGVRAYNASQALMFYSRQRVTRRRKDLPSRPRISMRT